MLNGHGDDGYKYKQQIIADFSTNVWYGGEPAGLKEHLFQQWKTINKYPEVLAESLCQKISRYHQLQPSNILITNGTTESIYLVAQAYTNSHTTIAIPAFAEYEDACLMHRHQVQFINLDALQPDRQLGKGLFFICNPANPTGQVFAELEALIKVNPDTLFVVDEAFIEFTFSITSLIPLINRYENIIILRSLTKAFAIPGLRLGYIAAHSRLIEKLVQHKAPWSVNALAIEAGHYIFSHYAHISLPLQQLLQDKEAFINDLQVLQIEVVNSHTHFFLAKMAGGTAKDLKAYLVQNHGLLVRDASNFRGLSPLHFRIATLSPQKNKLLTEALREWKKHCS
jgi:threonine-phosphate decarboxylase